MHVLLTLLGIVTITAECDIGLQGLFERHKLIVATQLCMAILKKNGELQQQKFDFLLRGPKVMGMENPLKEWILDSVWGSVQALKVSVRKTPGICIIGLIIFQCHHV